MLGIMRKYKQSIFIKGVFVLIVLSFVGTIFLIWGKGEEGLQNTDYAVKINGQKIPYEQFLSSYGKMKESIQQIYGQPVTPELEKQLGLKKLVIENLVGTTLMAQEAKRMGVKVSDKELAEEIAKIPYFQKDGAFDQQRYEQLLTMNRLTPRDFEKAQRQELTLLKARKQIVAKVSVSDQEALEQFKKQHDRIDLQFISIGPNDVRSAVKVTDQDLAAYLQRHEKEFRTQEKISISYLLLPVERILPRMTVTAEDIQTYYQKNIDRYQDKGEILPLESVKDRVKTDATKFKAAKQAYEMAAVALNANLKTGDLSAAARALGVPVNETALFTADNPPAQFANVQGLTSKAFFLKQGELGGPLETAQGVYLFKIKARNPAVVPPLAAIRDAVTKRYLDEKSTELAAAKATEIQAKLAQGVATGTLQETGLFAYSSKGEIPKVGTAPALMEAAFALTSKAPAPKTPLQINNRWYAIKLKSRIQGDQQGFAAEKSAIIEALLPQKQQQVLENWMKELRAKAKIVINPALTAE